MLTTYKTKRGAAVCVSLHLRALLSSGYMILHVSKHVITISTVVVGGLNPHVTLAFKTQKHNTTKDRATKPILIVYTSGTLFLYRTTTPLGLDARIDIVVVATVVVTVSPPDPLFDGVNFALVVQHIIAAVGFIRALLG